MIRSSFPTLLLLLLLLAGFQQSQAQCLSDSTLEADFLPSGVSSLPQEGSCCQLDICGIPCPEPIPSPSAGFGIVVGIFVAVSFIIGVSTYFVVAGKTENFFVAGRSLPIWILTFTLGAQAVDVNSLLTNSDLSYKYHFFDGACISFGIALSLFLNAAFLAHKIQADNVLTLPDVYAKRFGKTVEILVSLYTIASFLFLLAGNLLGLGILINYLWDFDLQQAVWLASGIVWLYTVSGGLFSVAYTDVLQGLIGWVGCFACAVYLVVNEKIKAPPPSIGVDGYIYPDGVGEGGVCDMYQGIPCATDPSLCCYNTDLWCPPNGTDCRADNGAYPIGDQRVFNQQMFEAGALSPFPNAILWNWATIIILGFGNLAALDFQARCMAAKTGYGARVSCFFAGCLTLVIGIPIAYLGSIMRVYYGPDSVHATFEADSCSGPLGLPTCGLWLPEPDAFMKLLTNQAPEFLGAWCLIGITAASMSTADGSILALGTVFANNIVRHLDGIIPHIVSDKNLLLVARLSTVPFALAAALIAAYYNSDHSAGAGYLLIVAFDVVLATAIAPLFGAFYCSKPSPVAALLSVLAGGFSRIIMEFALPKDGFLLLPFRTDDFLNYGSASSSKLPSFFDSADVWDPGMEQCDQPRYEDYTGVDSLGAFVLSIVVYILFQWLEDSTGKPLFEFPGGIPYDKQLKADETKDSEKPTKEKSDDLTHHVEADGTMMWNQVKFHTPEEVYA